MENIEATSVANSPATTGLGAATVMVAYTTIGLAMYGAFAIGKKVGQWITTKLSKNK